MRHAQIAGNELVQVLGAPRLLFGRVGFCAASHEEGGDSHCILNIVVRKQDHFRFDAVDVLLKQLIPVRDRIERGRLHVT